MSLLGLLGKIILILFWSFPVGAILATLFGLRSNHLAEVSLTLGLPVGALLVYTLGPSFYGLTEKDSKSAKNKLNLKDRKKVFLDYIRAQDQATKSAMAKYPNNIDKQINYQKTLESTNSDRIKKKYNITENKLVTIKIEGVKKKWEFY